MSASGTNLGSMTLLLPNDAVSQREMALSFPSGTRFVKLIKTTSIMAPKVPWSMNHILTDWP